MKSHASQWLGLALLAAMTASAHAGTGRAVLVRSPHGGTTAVSGTGACADVTFSGEKGDASFHVESITNRACRSGEAAGSRTYQQVNPTGPGTGGQRPFS